MRSSLTADRVEIERRVATRRKLLGWLVTTGVAPLVGCDGRAWSADDAADASTGFDSGSAADPHDAALDDPTPGDAATASAGSGNGAAGAGGTAIDAGQVDAGACTPTPAETGGPFPADSTIGPNVLVRNGIVRSDIRSSFAVGSATAGGVELQITLTVIDGATCRPRPGAVVYLWHCDREGRYSLYSAGVTDQDYLRGAQQADASGQVTFTTIFPGCYPGRWPHMHFEVFADAAAATTAGSAPVLTSQLAFLESDCLAAYSTAGYQASVSNLQLLSLQTDGVFRDGFDQQLATVTGTASTQLRAVFTIST